MKRVRALLINPWIFDFAAYDLWCKPLGLLTIASWLKQAGAEIHFIDCLDRFNPALLERKPRFWLNQQRENYFCGKFYKKKIQPPPQLAHIDRPYFQYGLPEELFINELKSIPRPNVCLIGSMMTFWYPAAIYTINLVKSIYPDIPIAVGGIYPTLYYEHALKTLPADYIHCGPPDKRLTDFLTLHLDICLNSDNYSPLTEPDFDLIHNKKSLSILTSVGCPFACTYCASKYLQPEYKRLSVREVMQRLSKYADLYSPENISFYDDALLYKSEEHIIPILEGWLETGKKINFHTPNGLHARFITKRLADLMYQTGFKSIRLSLETTDKTRQLQTGGKIYSGEMQKSIETLYNSGFKPENIYIYLLVGLPGQSQDEILNDIKTVYSMGARIELANFSPIPHTSLWDKLNSGGLISSSDPLYHNKSVFFLETGAFDLVQMRRLRKYVSGLNSKLK